MKKGLILANGDPPKKSVINYLQSVGYSILICADGGAESAKKIKITPDYIIGDFDSATDSTLKFFSNKSQVKKVTRQNDTDVEKGIKLALQKKIDEIILLGATGDRLDHSFCNIGILLKFSHKINLSILHGKSFMSVAEGNYQFNAEVGETISIYGIDSHTKITSSGLKYPLKNTSLPFGTRESTSNEAIKNMVSLIIKGGKVLIVREYEKLRKNGFFRSA